MGAAEKAFAIIQLPPIRGFVVHFACRIGAGYGKPAIDTGKIHV